MREVYSYEQESRLVVAKRKLKSRCPLCEHLVFIPREKNKAVCEFCGTMVYRNEKERFKEILKRKMGLKC